MGEGRVGGGYAQTMRGKWKRKTAVGRQAGRGKQAGRQVCPLNELKCGVEAEDGRR